MPSDASGRSEEAAGPEVVFLSSKTSSRAGFVKLYLKRGFVDVDASPKKSCESSK